MKDKGEVNIMNKTVDIRRFYEEDALALEDVIRKTWKYDAFCSSETAVFFTMSNTGYLI